MSPCCQVCRICRFTIHEPCVAWRCAGTTSQTRLAFRCLSTRVVDQYKYAGVDTVGATAPSGRTKTAAIRSERHQRFGLQLSPHFIKEYVKRNWARNRRHRFRLVLAYRYHCSRRIRAVVGMRQGMRQCAQQTRATLKRAMDGTRGGAKVQ